MGEKERHGYDDRRLTMQAVEVIGTILACMVVQLGTEFGCLPDIKGFFAAFQTFWRPYTRP